MVKCLEAPCHGQTAGSDFRGLESGRISPGIFVPALKCKHKPLRAQAPSSVESRAPLVQLLQEPQVCFAGRALSQVGKDISLEQGRTGHLQTEPSTSGHELYPAQV